MIRANLAAVGLLVLASACAGQQHANTAGPSDDEGWADAWASVSEQGAPSAETGEWVIERDGDAIRAYRRTEPVSGGGALGEIDDAAVEGRVYARLLADSALRGLGAKAEDGVVTLTGDVDSSRVAARAVRVALATPGVNEVLSRLSWDSP